MKSNNPTLFFCCLAISICSIIGLVCISLSVNKLNRITDFYSIILNSHKDNSNFLNIAISNLHPLQYFISLDCVFTRTSSSNEKQYIPLHVSYKKIKENRIIEDSHTNFDEKHFYFLPNSLNSSKHRLIYSLTEKVDAIRLQLSLTSNFGSLNGLYTETIFMANVKPGLLKALGFCFSLIFLFTIFSLTLGVHNKYFMTIALRTIILGVLSFVCINPFSALRSESSYTSFDYIVYPLFINFFRYFVFMTFYTNAHNLKLQERIEALVFFIALFTFEMQYGMQKIASIKKIGIDILPLSAYDYLLIILLSFYILISLYLFSFSKNWPLSHYFLCFNAQQMAYAALNISVLAFGRSISMNGKFIWCIVDILTVSMVFMTFHCFHLRKIEWDDENPLISESS